MSAEQRDPLRLIPFAALAALAATQWALLISEPPLGRALAAAALAGAGAVALLIIGRAELQRGLTALLGALAVVASLAAGLLALGFPADLIIPSGWDELASELSTGLSDLSDSAVPYSGESEWARLATLVALPLLLGAATVLAFWPGRSRGSRKLTLALLVLLGAFGYAVSMNGQGDTLLWGLALTVAVCAWLWLPGVQMPRAGAAAAMVAAAAVLALPAAALLDRDKPLLDYLSWSYPGAEEDVKYFWDHTYEPLDWPRTGAVMLEAQSAVPHYWRAITLDHFDGFTWQRSSNPSHTELAPGDQQNPKWIIRADVTIRGLDGGLVPTPGQALDVDELAAVISTSSGDGSILADEPLRSGESYSVLAYSPNPTQQQLSQAPGTYPRALTHYTSLGLPGMEADGGLVTSSDGPRVRFGLRVPPQGQSPKPAIERRIAASPYGDVYRLAHRITAGESTTYGAVQAIQQHLRTSYTYDENPPQRKFPLEAFLFQDRRGYCQQFSGAMALMLRMLGIPSRIAAGFAPGTAEAGNKDSYTVRDFDAHSWVEVYFRGIGWVTFDPTPPDAPTSISLSGAAAARAATGQGVPRFGGGTQAPIATDDSSSPTTLILLGGTSLLALAVTALFGWRWRRFRALPPAAAAAAQTRELRSALPRFGLELPPGATLLDLEQRVGTSARPRTAAYLARLRGARFEPGDHRPPTLAERRALRRELGSRGPGGRVRAFLTLPPGGP